jgi:hypothetical protein
MLQDIFRVATECVTERRQILRAVNAIGAFGLVTPQIIANKIATAIASSFLGCRER